MSTTWNAKRIAVSAAVLGAMLAVALVGWLLVRPDGGGLGEIVTVDAAGDTLVYSGAVRDAIARARIVEAFNSVTARARDSTAGDAAADSIEEAASEARAARQAAIDELARLYSDPVDPIAVVAALNLSIIDFEAGSAVLPADAAGFIQAAAEVIERAPDGTVFVVTGHARGEADPAEDVAVSERRAATVVAALVEAGADSDRVRAEGNGSASDQRIVFTFVDESEAEPEVPDSAEEGGEAVEAGEAEEAGEAGEEGSRYSPEPDASSAAGDPESGDSSD